MSATFDEMPGLTLEHGTWTEWLYFKELCLGRLSGNRFIPNSNYSIIPRIERDKITELLTNLVTAREVVARLKS